MARKTVNDWPAEQCQNLMLKKCIRIRVSIENYKMLQVSTNPSASLYRALSAYLLNLTVKIYLLCSSTVGLTRFYRWNSY